MKDGGRKTIKHPMSIYRCCVHDCIKKFAKFPSVKNKAHCKRLPIYSDLLPSYAAAMTERPPCRHGIPAWCRSHVMSLGCQTLLAEHDRLTTNGSRCKGIKNIYTCKINSCFSYVAGAIFSPKPYIL